MTGRVYTADYDRSNMTRKVWVPLILSGALGFIGLAVGQPIISFFGAMFIFIALRHWPLARKERPALILSSEGAEIDGLGLVKWGDVATVNSGMVMVKGLKIPALDITLRRPLLEVFHETEATRLRPWEFRVFKLRRDGQIRLDLAKMADTPEDIQQAFRYFISGQT